MGACLVMGCPAALVAQTTVQPEARGQTMPVPHSGDAADDPAVWIHPQEPGLSLILGTDVGAFSNQVTETLSAPARFYRLILNSGVEAE